MGANSRQYYCSDWHKSAGTDIDIIHCAILGRPKKDNPHPQLPKRYQGCSSGVYGGRIDLIDKAVWHKLVGLWVDGWLIHFTVLYQSKNPDRHCNRGCAGLNILRLVALVKAVILVVLV